MRTRRLLGLAMGTLGMICLCEEIDNATVVSVVQFQLLDDNVAPE